MVVFDWLVSYKIRISFCKCDAIDFIQICNQQFFCAQAVVRVSKEFNPFNLKSKLINFGNDVKIINHYGEIMICFSVKGLNMFVKVCE